MVTKSENILHFTENQMIGREAKVYFSNYFNILITPEVPGGAEIIHYMAGKPDPKKESWHNIRIN